MDTRDMMLAVLSLSKGESFSPVQIQKLFFIIDKKIEDLVYKPRFKFRPYNYGPFDINIYTLLEGLEKENLIEIYRHGNWKEYRITHKGQKKGVKLQKLLSNTTKKSIQTLIDYVQSLSFTELVSAIYKAYPEMSRKSVFYTS